MPQPEPQLLSRLHLSRSMPLRIGTFTLLYMAQGIPIGLLSIALPAWLASEGMSAGRIASLVAITGLPWGFKLIAGPFMDRFAFLPMGFRRPWVLGAQAGLTLSMLSMALVFDPSAQYWLMMGVGFAINCFSALQDVAVDGMAIDILPADERGKANAFMGLGQVVGFSAFAALNGVLLVNFGLPFTAAVSSLTIAVIFLLVMLIREREGEKMLPWSAGTAAPRTASPAPSFRVIMKDLLRVLMLPTSLVLTAAEFVARMAAGIAVIILPLIAVNELGYATEDYTFWYGLTSGVSALIGTLFGPLIDRYGAPRLFMIGLAFEAVMVTAFASMTSLWSSDIFVLTGLLMYALGSQLVFVAAIASFMNLCWNKVAASQFSVYMALANLARSAGAALYGAIATVITLQQALYVIAGLCVGAMLVLAFFRQRQHQYHLQQLIAAQTGA